MADRIVWVDRQDNITTEPGVVNAAIMNSLKTAINNHADAIEGLGEASGGIDATHEVVTPGEELITLPHDYIPGSLKVYRESGARLKSAYYTETTSNSFTLSFIPDSGETIIVDYKYLP